MGNKLNYCIDNILALIRCENIGNNVFFDIGKLEEELKSKDYFDFSTPRRDGELVEVSCVRGNPYTPSTVQVTLMIDIENQIGFQFDVDGYISDLTAEVRHCITTSEEITKAVEIAFEKWVTTLSPFEAMRLQEFKQNVESIINNTFDFNKAKEFASQAKAEPSLRTKWEFAIHTVK